MEKRIRIKDNQNIIGNWEYFKESSNNKWKLSELNKILLVIPGFVAMKQKELANSLKKKN